MQIQCIPTQHLVDGKSFLETSGLAVTQRQTRRRWVNSAPHEETVADEMRVHSRVSPTQARSNSAPSHLENDILMREPNEAETQHKLRKKIVFEAHRRTGTQSRSNISQPLNTRTSGHEALPLRKHSVVCLRQSRLSHCCKRIWITYIEKIIN
jgi:alpha-mannosidase